MKQWLETSFSTTKSFLLSISPGQMPVTSPAQINTDYDLICETSLTNNLQWFVFSFAL